MKTSIMLHGDPGIGKSAITEKTTQYMIPNSVDDIVSRSEKAIINPESGKHLYASATSHCFLIFLFFYIMLQ
jgi:ATP-dependent Clp protease ATP-binding subunit ClpA